jgi:adenylate cyclase
MKPATREKLTEEVSGARKLIAIVHADIAGYSRLIDLDDAGTLARVQVLLRDLIEPELRKHNGRLVNTAGDALLLEFTSTTAAVRCAVAMQRRVPEFDGNQSPDRRIRFRVGVNIGDVLADGTDIHGSGVNVAARLQAACPVGGVCVSRPVRDHVSQQLDLAFEPLGSLALKNIAQPVEAFVLRVDPAAAEAQLAEDIARKPSLAAGARWLRNRYVLPVGLALPVLVAGAGIGWWQFEPAILTVIGPAQAALPDLRVAHAPPLSVAVLPFRNISGDAEQEYLAGGIAEDLATDLSHIRGFFVTAHRSAFSYKGKSTVDARQIGNELGVRYLVEGSVRKVGDTLRVSAQLASCETGAEVWANRFDLPPGAFAEGQEEIIRRVAAALNVRMVDVESARSARERPSNADAFDLVLRARSLNNQPPSRERDAQAQTLYEGALQLDPSSVPAMLGVATVLINQSQGFLGQWAAADALERAGKLISDARALEPTSEGVLIGALRLLDAQHRWEDMIPAAERLIQAFPNRVEGYDSLATAKRYTGRAGEAVPLYEKSIRIDPRDPFLYNRYAFLGFALMQLQRWEESAIWVERSLAANPEAPRPIRSARFRILAADYAMTGRPDDAHRAVDEANKLWPFGTVRSNFPENPASLVLMAQIERLNNAQRLAGLRDHAEEDADFGVAPDDKLHQDLAGRTPTTGPGAATTTTAELVTFLAQRKPIVIDTALYSWGRSLPGAIGLKNAGLGGSFSDSAQDHLKAKMQELTKVIQRYRS